MAKQMPDRPAGTAELATALGTVARSLQRESPEATLAAITAAAVDTIPGAQHASVTVYIGRREMRSRAATDDVARRVGQAEIDTGQGPCVDALREQGVVRMNDIQAEQRWPDFTGRARELGVRSILGFRLFMQENTLGALNIYAADPDAFDEEAENIGSLFATHAAVALAAAEKVDQLQTAIDSRDIIGQAKGILMERYKVSSDEAFRLLIQLSQKAHRKLFEVARDLTATRDS